MHEPIAIANLAVLLVTAGVSALAFLRPELALPERLIFCPRRILAGKEPHRLITSALLHVNWTHLLFNMVSLYLFGKWLELLYGAGHFLMIYLGGILGGSLLSLFLHRHHDYLACGASGGVCGVIFASIFLLPGSSIHLLFIPIPIPGWLYAILFLLGSFYALRNRSDNIGHDAHLGGAIIGLLIATVLHPWIVKSSPWLYAATMLFSLCLMAYVFWNPLFLPWHAILPDVTMTRRPPPTPSDLPPHKHDARETDRILEKISTHGMNSLTEQERRHLDRTSERHRRRAETKKPDSHLSI